jgi:DNA mismatch repair protein MutL
VTPAEAADRGRRVRVLPAEVANQIAAGEVVERPASVVKELVENALDAGARHITVEMENAGTGLIAVVDDGEGMSAADAETAFSRHATSKLTSAEDLGRIATMGFRGEALASIAAVSRTTLVTRRPADLAATKIVVLGGKLVETGETGAPAGTRVEVADLFANVPARRKFLKAPATEVAHVTELVTRTALAWPEISFVLRHGGRTLLEVGGVEDEGERIHQVLGAERARAMLRFRVDGPAGHVSGWLGHAHLSFPNARQIYTYVNRRHVRDKTVTHGLMAGYSTLLMHGRYPAAVVFLEVAPEEVDVNVHPAKSEVRFRRSGVVHDQLVRAVRDGLRAPASLATTPPAPLPRAAARGPSPSLPYGSSSLRLVDSPDGDGRWSPSESTGVDAVAEASAPSTGFFASLRVLGQAFGGYLVCEGGDALVLIDQHAAHERVTFERLRDSYRQGAVERQYLLAAAVVELGAREAAALETHAAALDALGFEVEPYAGASFAVRAVPGLLSRFDPVRLLQDVAQQLAEVGRSRRVDEALEEVLSTVACHAAVRVGQNMGAAESAALLAAMDRADFSGSCPHGRPAFVRVPRGELERWFKRT